jgi:PRTRC genetic system protein B
MALKTQIQIEKSIAVYKCDKGQGETYQYLEMTDYNSGVPYRSYPAPLSFFRDLVKNFEFEGTNKFAFNIFDKNQNGRCEILGFNFSLLAKEIMFYTYPGPRTMLFSKSNIASGVYQMPGLIWKASDKKSLTVFAVREPFKELTGESQLYYAPFMNVSNGKVCIGSTEFPKEFDESIILLAIKIEEAFYKSVFTHFGHDTGLSKSNYYTLFKSIFGGKKPYPLDELVLVPNKKLSDVI